MRRLMWEIGRARCSGNVVRNTLVLAAAIGALMVITGCAFRMPDRTSDGKATWYSVDGKPKPFTPQSPTR